MSVAAPMSVPWAALFETAVWRPLLALDRPHTVAIVAIALGVALGLAVDLINRVASDEVQHAARSLFGTADLSVQASGAGFDETCSTDRAVRRRGRRESGRRGAARVPGRPRAAQADRHRSLSRAADAARGAGGSGSGAAGTALLADDARWLSGCAASALGAASAATSSSSQVGTRRCVAAAWPAFCRRASIGSRSACSTSRRRSGGCIDSDVSTASTCGSRPDANLQVVRKRIAALLPAGVQRDDARARRPTTP